MKSGIQYAKSGIASRFYRAQGVQLCAVGISGTGAGDRVVLDAGTSGRCWGVVLGAPPQEISLRILDFS